MTTLECLSQLSDTSSAAMLFANQAADHGQEDDGEDEGGVAVGKGGEQPGGGPGEARPMKATTQAMAAGRDMPVAAELGA